MVIRRLKRLKRRAKHRFDLFKPPEILPLRGHGTPRRIFVGGRVLEGDGGMDGAPDAARAPMATRFRRMIRRLHRDAIPDAWVEARLGRSVVQGRTDDEGIFHLTLDLEEALEPGWNDVELTLLGSMAGGEGASATAQVLVPPDDAAFGVISDLDGLVVRNSVTLLRGAASRVPFAGVAAFYRALKLGPDGRGANPIFYVSRSPWRLYDLFDAYLALHGIPRGTLFLQDHSKAQDKTTQLPNLFALYPRMSFVLIGDGGKEVPETFRDAAMAFPGRVKAIYIRDVTSRRRSAELREIADELRSHRVPMVQVKDSELAAAHAVEAGLIASSALEEIQHQARQDAPGTRLRHRTPGRAAASAAS